MKLPVVPRFHSMSVNSRRLFILLPLALLLAGLPSCAFNEKAPRLDPLAAINPLQKYDPLAPPSPLAASVVAQWEKDFEQPGFLESANGFWHTRAGRDELVYRLILMTDYRFNRYEADLVTGRATRDSFIDLAVLGLTSAATFLEPGQATRVLSAVSGGLIASRATIEKNFYQNQAQPVILRKMKVLREQKLFSISHRLRRYGVDVYPTERALIDVLDYYNRGTMLYALQEISNDTAAQEIEVRGGTVQKPTPSATIDDLPPSRLPHGDAAIPDLPPVRHKPDADPSASTANDIPDLPPARHKPSAAGKPAPASAATNDISDLPPAHVKPNP